MSYVNDDECGKAWEDGIALAMAVAHDDRDARDWLLGQDRDWDAVVWWLRESLLGLLCAGSVGQPVIAWRHARALVLSMRAAGLDPVAELRSFAEQRGTIEALNRDIGRANENLPPGVAQRVAEMFENDDDG